MSAKRSNNVGVLRLLLASLVIIGHASEMIDGNRLREPLTVLFGSLSLGELAVDCFFLLSGYLITGSMDRLRSVPVFLKHRAYRIYPAFITCFLVCVLVVAPWAGGHVTHDLATAMLRMLMLQSPPFFAGQFSGMQHYPVLNGSTWTIAYEFRCYLLVALLGGLGLLGRRTAILCVTILSFAAWTLAGFGVFTPSWGILEGARHVDTLLGDAPSTLRLTSIFMVSCAARLYWGELHVLFDARIALGSTVVAMASMICWGPAAESTVVLVGGVAVFWLAFFAPLGRLRSINDSWDISYGVYLYGWPAATCIRWMAPALSPWPLAVSTLLISFACGALSWWLVEKPMLARSHDRRPAASAEPIRLVWRADADTRRP